MRFRRFEMLEGGSSNFWEIGVEGATFEVRWGKIGGTPQVQTRTAGAPEVAEKEATRLIREKTKKGYLEVGAEAPAAKGDSPATPAAGAASADPKATASKSQPTPKKPKKASAAARKALNYGVVLDGWADDYFGGDGEAADEALVGLLDTGLGWNLSFTSRRGYPGARERIWELAARTLVDTVRVRGVFHALDNWVFRELDDGQPVPPIDWAAFAEAQPNAIRARFVRFWGHVRGRATPSESECRVIASDLASDEAFPKFAGIEYGSQLHGYLQRLDPSMSWEPAFRAARVVRRRYDPQLSPTDLVAALESVVAPISGVAGVPLFFEKTDAAQVLAGARAGLERVKGGEALSDTHKGLISVLVEAAFIRCPEARTELARWVRPESWAEGDKLRMAMWSLDVETRVAAMQSALEMDGHCHPRLLDWLEDQPTHPVYFEAVLKLYSVRKELRGVPCSGDRAIVAGRLASIVRVLESLGSGKGDTQAYYDTTRVYHDAFVPNLVSLRAAGGDVSPWLGLLRNGESEKRDRDYQRWLATFVGSLSEEERERVGCQVPRPAPTCPKIGLGPLPRKGANSIVRFDLRAPANGGAWRGGTLVDGRRLVVLLPIADIPEWRDRFEPSVAYVMVSASAEDAYVVETASERPAVRGGSALALVREEVPRGAFVSDEEEYPSNDDAADALIAADGHALGGPVWRGQTSEESSRGFVFQLNGDQAAWGLPGGVWYVLTNRIVSQN